MAHRLPNGETTDDVNAYFDAWASWEGAGR